MFGAEYSRFAITVSRRRPRSSRKQRENWRPQSKYDLEKEWFEIAPIKHGPTEEWLEKALGGQPVSPKKARSM